jgi:prepilin-type N-terminal cleavage/methylation domain-containing protein
MIKQFNNLAIIKKGVSLIEMLVAVAVFAITVGAISGIFISAVRTQRRILATQELLDQTSYVLEYMSRALRMAKRNSTATADCPHITTDCLSSADLNYETSGDQDLRFLNYNCICQRFFLDGTRLKEHKDWTLVGGVPSGGTENYLTSDKLKINLLKFNLSGQSKSESPNLQPRVTIFLEVEGREAAGSRPKIQIQTSISQRPLDQ